jgi:hypothetical protein
MAIRPFKYTPIADIDTHSLHYRKPGDGDSEIGSYDGDNTPFSDGVRAFSITSVSQIDSMSLRDALCAFPRMIRCKIPRRLDMEGDHVLGPHRLRLAVPLLFVVIIFQ